MKSVQQIPDLRSLAALQARPTQKSPSPGAPKAAKSTKRGGPQFAKMPAPKLPETAKRPDFDFRKHEGIIVRMGPSSSVSGGGRRIYARIEFESGRAIKNVLVGDKLAERLREYMATREWACLKTVTVGVQTLDCACGEARLYAASPGYGVTYAERGDIDASGLRMVRPLHPVALFILAFVMVGACAAAFASPSVFLILLPVLGAIVHREIRSMSRRENEIELRALIQDRLQQTEGLRLM